MNPILHPIFALLASVTRQDLPRQVACLKEEIKILRARLPERWVATPREKRRLLKFGRKLGVQSRDLISIVSYQTFVRWIREKEASHAEKKAASARKPGRPGTSYGIRDLVLKLARENDGGYTRILGELRRPGIKSVSRQTVKVILKEQVHYRRRKTSGSHLPSLESALQRRATAFVLGPFAAGFHSNSGKSHPHPRERHRLHNQARWRDPIVLPSSRVESLSRFTPTVIRNDRSNERARRR